MQPVLNPPDCFGIVEPQVYRCKTFQTSSFAFVERLQLKTVIFISKPALNRTVKGFLEERRINLINLKSYEVPIQEEVVKDALQTIMDENRYPVLIMCNSGIHLSGTVVACLRRLQGWILTAIMGEYRSMASFVKLFYENEQFIELFDIDLITLPRRLPRWFSVYKELQGHEADEMKMLGEGVKKADEYWQLMYSASGGLVSKNSTFSKAKSICEDDDD